MNSRRDAEECVNDAYLGAWNAIPPTRPEPLLSYIVKIVRNVSLKIYYRKEAAKRNSTYTVAMQEIEACIADQKTVEDEVEARELARIIESFLDTLTTKERIIFMRRYAYIDTYADIAKRMRISEKSFCSAFPDPSKNETIFDRKRGVCMNTKLFSDAMNEIDSKYYEEAMTELQPDRLHLKWWKLHKVAACFATVMLMGVLSFGTAFAASADFREAVIGFFTGGFVEQGVDEQGYYSVYFHGAGNSDPITVRDGQIYFVMDSSEINITEQCSETTYYSYETTDADGNYHVILVGGTPDNAGWAELVFENDSTKTGPMVTGEYEDEEPEWLLADKKAFTDKYMADRK